MSLVKLKTVSLDLVLELVGVAPRVSMLRAFRSHTYTEPDSRAERA
jgi:hypothetical protein